jgi:hypothetical protein
VILILSFEERISIAKRITVSPFGGGAGGGFSNYIVILIIPIEARISIAKRITVSPFGGGLRGRIFLL